MERNDENRARIALARDGDRTAFASLFAELEGRLRGFVTSRLGRALAARVDLEDVLQETSLRALRSIERFEDRGGDSFFRWLAGIANHVVLEAARRERRDGPLELELEPEAEGVTASREARRSERFERLQEALDGLSEEHRQVIVLARFEKLSMRDVGKRMGRSPEAASQLLWRALRRLRESFGETDSFHLPDRELLDRKGRHD